MPSAHGEEPMNPKNRNGPPKVVDSAPQESLLPAGRPGFSKFPLEDRSDRLCDPPSTLFPAGEVAGPTTPVGGPGPSGTASRGRDDALDTRLLPKPSMGRLGIVVGIGQQTPDGSMTHRLLDPGRKQPRRAPGAGPNPLGPDDLGPDPHDHRQPPGPPSELPDSITPRGFRRSTSRIHRGPRGGPLRGGSGPRDGRPDGRSRPDRRTRRTGEPLLLRPAHAMDAVCPGPERRTRRRWAGPCLELYIDAHPVCAFSSGRARSSVLGVRASASDWLRCRVPGPRCRIAGTRYLVAGTCLRKTRTRGMHRVSGPSSFPFGSRSEQRMTVTLRRP